MWVQRRRDMESPKSSCRLPVASCQKRRTLDAGHWTLVKAGHEGRNPPSAIREGGLKVEGRRSKIKSRKSKAESRKSKETAPPSALDCARKGRARSSISRWDRPRLTVQQRDGEPGAPIILDNRNGR